MNDDLLIFVDFDGVLRRNRSPLYVLEEDLVANFESLLTEFPRLLAVITSSWREVYSLEQLKTHFPVEIRERFIEVTPISKVPSEHQRHKEILAFLKFHGKEGAHWIAVDDDPEYFPPSAPLIIVDPSKGLDTSALKELRAALLSLTVSIAE